MTNKEQFDMIEQLYLNREINLEKYEDMQRDLFKNWPFKNVDEFYKNLKEYYEKEKTKKI